MIPITQLLKLQLLILVTIHRSTTNFIKGFSPQFQVSQVPKVNAVDFDVHKHYFHTVQNGTIYETPVLVENVLSPSLCEEMCDSIGYNLGHVTVDVQRKQKFISVDDDNKNDDDDDDDDVQTDIYEYALYDAFALMMESSHYDSFFCFCEGLLDYTDSSNHDNIDTTENNDENNEMTMGNEDIKQLLATTKEDLFGCSDSNHGDLFDSFPKNAKPSDCVIIAGSGATSTLHRDPFCWTGTSICLEGTKVWRFIAPPGAVNGIQEDETDSIYNDDSGVNVIDSLLNAYRLSSIAWEGSSRQEDSVYLSSGWQSDYSLFSSFNNYEEFPSAEELELMNKKEKLSVIENLANNLEELSPNCPKTYIAAGSENQRTQVTIWTVVQKPGDLLVIPAFWWHQTYALEPSVAVASQRCGEERDCPRVLKHILDTSGRVKNDEYPPFVQEEYIANQSTEALVDELFQYL